jgi:hypothetical protein
MSITQGAPLPDIKQTTTTQDTAPSYYTNYLSGLSTAGTTAMGKTPSQSVASYDPLQVMGYNNLPSAATAGQAGINAAQATAAQAAQGVTPERIQAFMNPYTSNVVDEMGRLSQQNVQRNLLPTMKAGFVGTGGLGSQRYAGALGQSLADVQAGLTGQQYGALSQGYTQAMKGALDEASLLNQTAGTQGRLADEAQSQALTGAGALTKGGAERQAYQQSLIDAPLRTATTASGLMRGYTMPTNQTQTFTGPKAGQYQLSDLQQLLTGLSGLGAVNTTAGAKLIGGLGGGLTDILKGIFSGGNKISYNGNQPIDSGDVPVFDPNDDPYPLPPVVEPNVGNSDVYGNQTFYDPTINNNNPNTGNLSNDGFYRSYGNNPNTIEKLTEEDDLGKTPYDPIFYQGKYNPNTRRFGYDGDENQAPFDTTRYGYDGDGNLTPFSGGLPENNPNTDNLGNDVLFQNFDLNVGSPDVYGNQTFYDPTINDNNPNTDNLGNVNIDGPVDPNKEYGASDIKEFFYPGQSYYGNHAYYDPVSQTEKFFNAFGNQSYDGTDRYGNHAYYDPISEKFFDSVGNESYMGNISSYLWNI